MELYEEAMFRAAPEENIVVEFKHNGIAPINVEAIREHGKRVSYRMSTRIREEKIAKLTS